MSFFPITVSIKKLWTPDFFSACWAICFAMFTLHIHFVEETDRVQNAGTGELAEGNVTCENKKPVAADIMEVDASDNKVKMVTNPAAVEVTPPPVSTKNSALSKPTKKRITPIAI